MHTPSPACEQDFFDIFKAYYNLEQNTSRKYDDFEYTLDRMRPLAELAGNPQDRLAIIHVAGTKGKGSTVHFTAALLTAAGKRCGTFTSPHLVTVRERFQIDNRFLPLPVLIQTAREFEKRLQQAGLKPTLFEIMTILALRLFADQGCDYAILETGIGGTLDATNFIDAPVCCAITSVSYDHTQLLGGHIAQIAAQKAGIIKPGIPVVLGKQPFPEAEEVIVEIASQRRAPLLRPVPEEALAAWPVQGMPEFLRDNARTALAIVRELGLSPLPSRFELPTLPGRCELVGTDPPVILDAAHNADSAAQLATSLKRQYPSLRFTIVLGVVQGKDSAGILKALASLEGDLILTHPRPPKRSDLDNLRRLADQMGLAFTVRETISSRADLPANTPLLFTGSFFTALIGTELFPAAGPDQSSG